MGVSEKKQAIVAELKEQLASAKSVVLTGYKGLTVAQDTELRRELREAGVSYHVVKNTMLRLAAKEARRRMPLLRQRSSAASSRRTSSRTRRF